MNVLLVTFRHVIYSKSGSRPRHESRGRRDVTRLGVASNYSPKCLPTLQYPCRKGLLKRILDHPAKGSEKVIPRAEGHRQPPPGSNLHNQELTDESATHATQQQTTVELRKVTFMSSTKTGHVLLKCIHN